MDAIRPGRSIAAVFEPRCGTGRRAISRILDQFGDHAIPGGHARAPAPRNRGGATRCIDDDLRKDDLRPSAITRTTDNAAVRRDADCAQPIKCNPDGDSLVAKALVETGAIDHIPDAAGMTQKVLVVRRARTVCSPNPETGSGDLRIVEQMFKSHRRDSDERGRSKELKPRRRLDAGICENDRAAPKGQQACGGQAGRPRADHETVGAQHVQGQISPGR